jgi:hypothetical protein
MPESTEHRLRSIFFFRCWAWRLPSAQKLINCSGGGALLRPGKMVKTGLGPEFCGARQFTQRLTTELGAPTDEVFAPRQQRGQLDPEIIDEEASSLRTSLSGMGWLGRMGYRQPRNRLVKGIDISPTWDRAWIGAPIYLHRLCIGPLPANYHLQPSMWLVWAYRALAAA